MKYFYFYNRYQLSMKKFYHKPWFRVFFNNDIIQIVLGIVCEILIGVGFSISIFVNLSNLAETMFFHFLIWGNSHTCIYPTRSPSFGHFHSN